MACYTVIHKCSWSYTLPYSHGYILLFSDASVFSSPFAPCSALPFS